VAAAAPAPAPAAPAPAPAAPAASYTTAAPAGSVDPSHFTGGELWTTPSHLLADRGAWAFRTIQRVRSGGMEQHDRWNSLLVIREGQATVEFYAAQSGSQEVPAGSGEHRGGAPVGEPTRVVSLASGDVLLIPPRSIYRFVIPEGRSIRYLQVKTPPP
jgi:hypothetical protein